MHNKGTWRASHTDISNFLRCSRHYWKEGSNQNKTSPLFSFSDFKGRQDSITKWGGTSSRSKSSTLLLPVNLCKKLPSNKSIDLPAIIEIRIAQMLTVYQLIHICTGIIICVSFSVKITHQDMPALFNGSHILHGGISILTF